MKCVNIQTVNHKGISFINVSNPGQFEIKYLKNNFDFNSLLLDDHTNKTEVPKVEVFKNYSAIILDLPYYTPNGSTDNSKEIKKKGRIPVKTLLNISQATLSSIPLPKFSSEKKRRLLHGHVDLFIGKDYVVVLHDGVLPQIEAIFAMCQKTLHHREEFLGHGAVFLAYRIIDALVDGCFPIMNEISSMIDKIDRQLEIKQTPSTLEDISITRRNVVVFHTMMKTIIPIFKRLEEGVYKELNGPMQSFWSNVLDHLENILDRLEDSRELIEGISESNEFLLRSKTNEIMKVLTIFSAIILPLNLIASIYGMNLKFLPFSEDEFSFGISIVSMAAIAFVMLAVFRIKRWF